MNYCKSVRKVLLWCGLKLVKIVNGVKMMLMLKREMLTRLDDKASDSDVTVRNSDRRAAARLKSFRDPRRRRMRKIETKGRISFDKTLEERP